MVDILLGLWCSGDELWLKEDGRLSWNHNKSSSFTVEAFISLIGRDPRMKWYVSFKDG